MRCMLYSNVPCGSTVEQRTNHCFTVFWNIYGEIAGPRCIWRHYVLVKYSLDENMFVHHNTWGTVVLPPWPQLPHSCDKHLNYSSYLLYIVYLLRIVIFPEHPQRLPVVTGKFYKAYRHPTTTSTDEIIFISNDYLCISRPVCVYVYGCMISLWICSWWNPFCDISYPLFYFIFIRMALWGVIYNNKTIQYIQ